MQKYPGQKSGSWRYHHDGFDYRIDNPNTIRTQEYRCTKRNCHGRAKHPRANPDDIEVKAIHNHSRDADDFRTWKYREVLIERAKNDLGTPIAQLFRNISEEYQDVAVHVDPVRERRKMRRVRRKLLPKCPSDYDELADLLQKDEQIKRMYGSCDPVPGQDERETFFQGSLKNQFGTTLVFASPHLLEKLLSKSTKCKLDATFSVLPMKPKGRQLLTIHATDGIYTFPVVYAVMQSKKKVSYIQLFEYIKLLCPEWNPEEMMMDFEPSLRNAFQTVYPDCRIIGCYFHYTQAIQKNWSRHGLMKVKKVHAVKIKEIKRSILALALGRAEDIPTVYNQIVERLKLSILKKVQSFLNYFQRTWLSNNNKNFKPEDWSVYKRPDRTNNHVESFHSTLQEVRPNIWVFLKLLVSLNIEARINYGRSKNGHEIHSRIPRKILLTDQRIANATDLFEAKHISAFTYVMWCRTAITSTLAVVRQGRRLKRYLKANFHELEYDDVATSSDSSVNSGSFDWEYDPNPHQEERMEMEDIQYDIDWRNDLAENGAEILSNSNRADSESIPPSDDSMWALPDGTADLLLLQNAQDDDEETPPNVVVPTIHAAHRAPMSCVRCLDDLATWIAMPCRHLLVCQGCYPAVNNICIRCKETVTSWVDAITT